MAEYVGAPLEKNILKLLILIFMFNYHQNLRESTMKQKKHVS